MKESEKVWFLYTINTNGLPHPASVRYFCNARRAMLSEDESIKQIFVPSTTEPTSVKLIYDPKGNENGNNNENLRLVNEYLKSKLKELE